MSASYFKIIGLFDMVITVSVVTHICVYIVLPLSVTVSSDIRPSIDSSSTVKSATHWIWLRIVFAIVGSLVPILASIALIKLPTTKSFEESANFVKFWIHCSLFTIVTAFLTFISVLVAFGYQSWTAYPILLYVLFRAGVTISVSFRYKQMCPRLEGSVNYDDLQAKRELTRQLYSSLPPYKLRLHPHLRPAMHVQDPVLPLKQYRATGLSVPNCQCINGTGID